MVNRIQKSRKDLDFNVDDRIKVHYQTDEELGEAISKHSEYIEKETLTTELSEKSGAHALEFKIDEHKLFLSIERV